MDDQSNPRPSHGTWRYIVTVIVVTIVSGCVEKAFEPHSQQSREYLSQHNDHFVKGIEQIEPFRLGRVFYGALWNGPPQPWAQQGFAPYPDPKGLAQAAVDLLFQVEWVLTRIAGAIAYTYQNIASGGLPSAGVAIMAILFGYLVMRRAAEESGGRIGPVHLFLMPAIGACFVWAIIIPMWTAGKLFGWALAAAQLIAGCSAAGTAFGWAGWQALRVVAKEREHHITDSIVEFLISKRPAK
jgi:hypothetical protein